MKTPVHAKIRQYVIDHNLRQTAIAARMNISTSKLSLILNGHRKLLADEYFDLCAAIGVKPEVFIPNDTN